MKSVFNSILKKINKVKDVEVLDVSHMSRKVIKDGTSQIPIEYYYTEITNKNVNKWTAIEFLLNKLHIQKEDVIGIGDNVNDKEFNKLFYGLFDEDLNLIDPSNANVNKAIINNIESKIKLDDNEIPENNKRRSFSYEWYTPMQIILDLAEKFEYIPYFYFLSNI